MAKKQLGEPQAADLPESQDSLSSRTPKTEPVQQGDLPPPLKRLVDPESQQQLAGRIPLSVGEGLLKHLCHRGRFVNRKESVAEVDRRPLGEVVEDAAASLPGKVGDRIVARVDRR